MKSLNEVVEKVLNDENIQETIAVALIAQGNAENGAKMQLGFLRALVSSSKVAYGLQRTERLTIEIMRTLSDRVGRFGERAYPLSEKQIAVLAREIAEGEAETKHFRELGLHF